MATERIELKPKTHGNHIIGNLQTLFRGHPEKSTGAEKLTLRDKFTDEERRALVNDGALIYETTGKFMFDQSKLRTDRGLPGIHSHGLRDGAISLRDATKSEFAIYPDSTRFFVPNSFNQTLKRQEELVAKDAVGLRLQLQLPKVTEIIPDAVSTLTDIVFQHFDATGEWLFGEQYARSQGHEWSYIDGITHDFTNLSHTEVAIVGSAGPWGLCQDTQPINEGSFNIGAVRLVVPINTKNN